MTHKRTRSEKKLAEQGHYEAYSKKGGSANAKNWFDRKPYSVRGDTVGKQDRK